MTSIYLTKGFSIQSGQALITTFFFSNQKLFLSTGLQKSKSVEVLLNEKNEGILATCSMIL